MFDISFGEVMVFAIIALIVLGPEKLPRAARTAGTYYAKMRRTFDTLKSEIEAEMDLVETRQKMQEELAKIRQAEQDMQKEMVKLRQMHGRFSQFEQQSVFDDHQNAQTQSDEQVNTASVYNKTPLNNRKESVNQSPFVSNDNVATPPCSKKTEQPSAQVKQNLAPDSFAYQGLSTRFLYKKDSSSDTCDCQDVKPWQQTWVWVNSDDKRKHLLGAPFIANMPFQSQQHNAQSYEANL